MPNLISRLNCFSKKKNGKEQKRSFDTYEEDENGDPLVLASAGSNSTSITQKVRNSDPSNGSKRSSRSLKLNHHYDDDNSIPTMDSDYNNIQSGNFSLSDAGGTINTQNQSLTNFSQGASTAFGSVAPSAYFGAASGQDYNPYSSHLLQSPQKQHREPQQEEMLEIYAPGGKLGLVIDTPHSSTTPVVHAIKDTCPIRNEIYVGDLLVAVDDVDVRDMSAQEVSRLISRKSGQERRKLTIIRTARGRDGIY